jgi:hypothetical protein
MKKMKKRNKKVMSFTCQDVRKQRHCRAVVVLIGFIAHGSGHDVNHDRLGMMALITCSNE